MRRLATVLIALAACADPSPLPDLVPGERPAPDTEEAGLWMQAERAEDSIRTSALRVKDPVLVGYVQGIVDRIAGPHAKNLRLYILQVPGFNAFVFPNGAMVVLTGLILRAENESQLASVLGHEITHYTRRHGVLLYLSARSKSSFAAFFQTFASAALLGDVGTLVGYFAVGSIFRFSRDQELDADNGGLDLMAKGGYDPRQGPLILENCLHETESAGKSDSASFFGSHPATRERIAALRERKGSVPEQAARDAHREFLAPHRLAFLRDEIRRNDPAGLQVLLDRLFATGSNLGEIHFIQGEVFRLRRGKDDGDKAIAAYRSAVDHPGSPPEAHQMMGILYLKKGEKEQARTSFLRYLELRPEAQDAEMIQSYLRQMKEGR